MTKLRYILIFIALLAMSCHVFSQSIQTDLDKKVIYTDSLNMPRNARAAILISLLPELLERPSSTIVSNYDIQIEGMSVGNAADVALNQLLIVDIESIEVSESPISSFKNNGQGGSINFKLRTSGIKESNTWGSVGSSIDKTNEIAPQFTIGYKNNKFMIRGIALGELSKNNYEDETITFKDNAFDSRSCTESENKFATHVVHAFMQYQLSDKEMLKLNVSEMYSHNKIFKTTNYDDAHASDQENSYTNIQANLKYEHTDRKGKFTANVQYGYNPNNKSFFIPEFYSLTSKVSLHNISGKLSYKFLLFDKTTDNGLKKNANLEFGNNFNNNFKKENSAIQEMLSINVPHTTEIFPKTKSYYLMPYLCFDCSINKLRLKTTFEFQHLKYDIRHDNNTYGGISNSFTGKLMAEWHFTPHKNIRFILNRTLERPTEEQLYPYMIFNPNNMEYVKGNAELDPMMTHAITIDYIADYRWKTNHSLIVNVGTSLSRVNNIIGKVHPNSEGSDSGFGASLNYLSYLNNGDDIITSANLMALYSYKTFSLSFTGNMYHKMQENDDTKNHYTYFNLALFPHFNLQDGWHGGARIQYASKVDLSDGTLGDYAIATITVGKSWNNLFVYLTESMPFDTKSKNISWNDNIRTEDLYSTVQNTFTIGLKYAF